jgi:hypothetical protein
MSTESLMAPTWSNASCQSSWVTGGKVNRGGERGRVAATEFVPFALLLVGEVGQGKSFFNISIKTLLMESTRRSANS